MRPNPQRGRELIAAAVVWLHEGVSTVPAQPMSKAVRLRWREYERKRPDLQTIRRWFASGVNNLAVVCGSGGLLVLDFDDLAKYRSWREKAGSLAGTYTETSGRGVHLFYLVDHPVTKVFEECESLGLGHLCNVAPSIHPQGSIYKPVGDPCTPLIQTTTAELFSLLSEKKSSISARWSRWEAAGITQPAVFAKAGKVDVIGKIKAAIPLLSYAATLTDLKLSGEPGRWFVGKCPFHEDENPSFWVDAKRGVWRCFSPSCKGSRGGDLLNLYALRNNITVHDAIKRLACEVL